MVTYESNGRTWPIDVFTPDAAAVGAGPYPAVLFFHGGAWRMGDRAQFHPQCRRFAEAGYVAATAAYSLDGPLVQCARDAQAALTALVGAADDLRIDTDRLVVGGGSAGGHLAACLAACPEVLVDVALAAVVLFNPVLDLTATARSLGELCPEIGVPPEHLSPIDQELGGLPPTIVFHGTADSLVPIEHSRRFRAVVVAAGARCELVEFDGREHAFFNPVPPEFADLVNAGDFDATVSRSLAFLGDVLGSGAASRSPTL